MPNLNWWKNKVDIDRHELSQTLSDNARLSATYLFLLVAATILATLGLLINSAAVIIGAMIISPLTWPILRTAYGIAAFNLSSLFKGLRLLLVSVGLILGVSFLLTLVLPLNALTDQIINRTTPTILDLVIALIAGAISGLTLINKKISKTAAGVAVAASLLPPMCVGGIGLGLGLFDITFGGILLSVTNIIAILFVCAILLAILIKPDKDDLLARRGIISVVGIILIIMMIPLIFFFTRYVEKIVQPETISIVRNTLSQEISGSYIQNIQISKDTVTAIVLIPNGTYISPTIKEDIQREMNRSLKKDYFLDLHLIRELSN